MWNVCIIYINVCFNVHFFCEFVLSPSFDMGNISSYIQPTQKFCANCVIDLACVTVPVKMGYCRSETSELLFYRNCEVRIRLNLVFKFLKLVRNFENCLKTLDYLQDSKRVKPFKLVIKNQQGYLKPMGTPLDEPIPFIIVLSPYKQIIGFNQFNQLYPYNFTICSNEEFDTASCAFFKS